ncbi:MAG: LapA family protein [Proteobacteria bacterium]|nr:LapA family protein [Pseudomonadota bacterium]
MQLITIVAMLVAAAGVSFALQNDTPATVTFLLWHFEASLAAVLLLTLAAGGFIVALVSTPATLRRQWAMNRQNKRLTELENLSSHQQETIARLERLLPTVEIPVEEPLSYVGLKQVIGSIGGDDNRP